MTVISRLHSHANWSMRFVPLAARPILVLPALGGEGHWLVESEGGVKSRPELDRALNARSLDPAKKR